MYFLECVPNNLNVMNALLVASFFMFTIIFMVSCTTKNL
jgi:hypothetical protein